MNVLCSELLNFAVNYQNNTYMNLNDKVAELFREQTRDWDLARENFDKLKAAQIRSFSFGDFDVKVQYNPARFLSTTAKTTMFSAERKCFLCSHNLPEQQQGIDSGDFTVLVNPYPIFTQHFTIPHKEHIAQQIKPFYKDMLFFAKELTDYLIFYNGPQCGASAPDHMHFQAGNKDFLPLFQDYINLKDSHGNFWKENAGAKIYVLNDYLRSLICIEAENEKDGLGAFNDVYAELQTAGEEPMMNIVCIYEKNRWYTFVFPRQKSRPWQFSAPDEKDRLLISPGTVEMGGIFITPNGDHFEKITKHDIIDIYQQISKKI